MEPIAIVGLSFRLPQGIEDEDTLWKVLEERQNTMTEWPQSRINVDSLSEHPVNLRARGGHFVEGDPASFDAPFFSTTTREAAAMDPQQRWAMETAYHAFENAGWPVSKLRGSRVAVFGSSMSDDYGRILSRDPDVMPQMAIIGTQSAILANRVSWFFGLSGPSMTIDTACSSSMVSVDLACQSLRNGEATSALVFGSNLMMSPENSMMLGAMNFTSPDSVCWSFDARANGYGRGEGIIAMVLKPVSAAIQDGDLIRAVIRSSGCNQDGRTPGLTQPSIEAQESLIRHVYDKAKLDYSLTRYVEAHGTGTAIGDPIEMEAIGRVFGPHRTDQEPLIVGSVKANIGHLEAGSGLAGILKSILILERGTIPPNALFEKINPRIDLQPLRTEVPTQSIKWPSSDLRRISVNSFGFGGTNSHVVLDCASQYLNTYQLNTTAACTKWSLASQWQSSTPELLSTTNSCMEKPNQDNSVARTWLLVWNASSARAANKMAQEYYAKAQLDNQPLSSLAYTLDARREKMKWRAFSVVSSDKHDKVATQICAEKAVQASSKANNLTFVFTGQGAQYTSMGQDLLIYGVFEHYMREADRAFTKMGCTWSVFDAMQQEDRIHRPEYSQPLCTALQIALVELLRSFGITPKTVVGHSSGEIAAAYTVGALSLESAYKTAFYRGLVAGQIKESSKESPGAMMSVNLAEGDIFEYLDSPNLRHTAHEISIACVNSPSNCTIAGSETSIDIIKEQLDKDEIFARKLQTGIPYHTPTMNQASAQYFNLLGQLDASASTDAGITMRSTVSGQVVSHKVLCKAQYWVDNLTSQVKFSQAVTDLVVSLPKTECVDFVEIGPHSALQRPLLDIASQDICRERKIWYQPTLVKPKSSHTSILTLMGRLFCRGHSVSISEVNMQASDMTRAALIPITDCPKYPFDHSHKFWLESRCSKDFRLRAQTTAYVLGQRSYDWNPLEPTWRNFLCTDTMPWLGDHVVSGKILFPGAGMLVMAMEAARELSSQNRSIRGFCIKEAIFLRPITVGKTVEQATETVTRLRPLRRTFEKETLWSEVSVFAVRQGHWDECFKATLHLDYEDPTAEVDEGRENVFESQHVMQMYEHAVASSTTALSHKTFYNFCQEIGITYGKSFQLLDNIRFRGSQSSTARMDLARAAHQESDLVHPTVLDAALHLVMAQMAKRRIEEVPTMVPHQMKNGWIAATGWNHLSTSHIRFASSSKRGQDQIPTDSALYGLSEDGSVLCMMEQVTSSPVSRSQPHDARPSDLLHSIVLKPHLSALKPRELQQLCAPHNATLNNTHGRDIHHYTILDLAMAKAIGQALRAITDGEAQNVPAHIAKYTAVMEEHIKNGFGTGIETTLGDQDLESLLQICEENLPELEMTSIIARNLPGILTGAVDPLELVFSTDCAERLYRDIFHLVLDDRFQSFIDLACHETPQMKILEVGAGTGSFTQFILSTIRGYENIVGAELFAEYVYTDISAGFFEKARVKFKEFEERMDFKTFDLSSGASAQGFEPESFDMIIAGSVLHATPDLLATLRGLRSLLKPGGHLINLEMVNANSPCLNVTFGVLPGWWLSIEDWRATSPLITEQQWDCISRETGFSGNDLIIRDFDSDIWHISSLMITTAIENSEETLQTARTIVVADSNSKEQLHLASMLSQDLNLQVLSLEDAASLTSGHQDIVLCLLEFEKQLLAKIPEQDFKTLQILIERSQKLLWVASSSIDDPKLPFNGIMQGLIRSIRSESAEKQLATLSLETTPSSTATDCSAYIQTALRSAFFSTSKDLDFVVKADGLLSAQRATGNTQLNEIHQSLLIPKSVTEPWSSGPPLKLTIGTPGALDTLHYSEDFSHQEALGSDEIEIEAKVWSVSFRDIFLALGRLPSDEELGYECAGVVTRVGSQVRDNIRPGDRVCMVSPGCMRTYPRARAEEVWKIPDSFSFEEVASIMNPATTAYYALVNLARLQKGDKVLIHSAAGSTGQMAVSIAKMIGAEIFATVGFETKKQLLMDEYGIPSSHIFYSRNTSFAKGIRRLTNGRGVDVVLNSLSGDGLRASWECVTPYGRFVEIGKSDIMNNSSLPMSGFAKNVSFFAFDLYHMIKSRPDTARDTVGSLIDLLSQGKIKHPKPIHKYGVSDVEVAFRFIQSGKNTGRVVISVDRSEDVSKLICSQSKYTFRSEATYIVVGGLGGLGRAVIKWMARQGAKNLIVVSRSGPTSQLARDVLSDLKAAGLNIATPTCDASSMTSLSKVLDDCAKMMPPIRGCINAAMVLQDAVFQNMSHDQWRSTIQSKVQVSWNLHQLFPKLDFFVLLSSLSGIYGSIGQANYSAGCTFQDALAQYRSSRGDNTTSLDLGWMREIGIIAETEKYEQHRQNAQNMIPLEEAELLAILDICCRTPDEASGVARCQILMGAMTPAASAARGLTPDPSSLVPFFSTFSRTSNSKRIGLAATTALDYGERFKQATDISEKVEIFNSALAAKLARALSIPTNEIESEKKLYDYGIDSLMGVELRNWIRKDFGADVAMFDIMGRKKIKDIGKMVASQVSL